MVMVRIKLSFFLLMFWVLAGTVAPGPVMSGQTNAVDTVRAMLDTIKQIQNGDALTPKQAAANKNLQNQALTYLDIPRVSQKSLGKHWKKRSAAERKKFTLLLSGLFKYVAFPNSAKFFSDLKLEFGDSQVKNGRSIVPLKVTHKDEGEVFIDFILEKEGDDWRVVDVILDGVSMRNNLRTQFYRVLKKEDYSELMRRMRKKLQEAKG